MDLRSHSKEKGAALIAALLIIAIVASIATDLLYRTKIDIQRSRLLFSAEQAELDNRYAIAFAQLIYASQFSTKQQSDPNYKPPSLPILMPTQTLDSASLNATFSSAQGLFNLNNLSETSYIPLFAQLIQQVDREIKADKSLEIAKSVAYFINNYVTPELERLYSNTNSPYRVPHRLLTSPSELRLIDQITPSLYTKLLPYIIALPKKTSLNPSNAPYPVLLAYGISNEGAEALVNAQKIGNFPRNMNDFYTLAKLNSGNAQSTTALFDFKNQYFLLTTKIKERPIDWTIYTLLEADKMGEKLNLLQITKNTL